MKTSISFALLVFSTVSACSASIITLASSATSTANNTASPTVNISKHPGWADPLAGSSWISTASTGNPSAPGYTVFPNGTVIGFEQSFFVNAPVLSASLSVMADDTASVSVNGISIFAAAISPSGPACAANAIGCLASTMKTFKTAELAPYLNVGAVNTVTFQVYQVAGSSFALDYAGQITTNAPEPGTFAALGLGFCGLAFLRRRRLQGN